ncbi:MAG: hypothetical protein LBH61_07250 [Dysgonamonadaceae bacterium]|jgi:hypothetical protein|nr:hypothetical protein [Dysgonamonadaceae bacterium]
MNNYNDIYYTTPHTGEFYRDCISHSVRFHLDRMPDHSWRRISSDRPLEWILSHPDQITTHFLIVRNHVLESDKERWQNDKHLEVNFELRENNATYIFSAEIDYSYLAYFVRKYGLTL